MSNIIIFAAAVTEQKGLSETSIVAIIVALLSLVGTLAGSYFAQKKTTALVVYRLEQLENKVHKHNNLIERTYAIEKKCEVYDEKFKVANHRLDDLEEKVN